MAVPTRDATLVPFATSADALLQATGSPYPVSTAQVQTFHDRTLEYVAAQTAVETAREQGLRSVPLTAARDAARGRLLVIARNVYATVASSPDVSDADKIRLGVHVADRRPTPSPVPSARPTVEVVGSYARTVLVRIHDNGTGRGRPRGTTGAYVYTFVGEAYPTDPGLWAFDGKASRSTYEVEFPNSVPSGAQVWVCAAYTNQRGQTGPVSLPVTTNVQGGMTSMAA